MNVKVIDSPNRRKKFRAVFSDGVSCDFGAATFSDYLTHRDPFRMRSYILRHGGNVPESTKKESDSRRLHDLMLDVDSSRTEDWTLSGVQTAGFWSRWYLWSGKSKTESKKILKDRFGLHVR